MDFLTYSANTPLFSKVSEKELQYLEDISLSKTYPKGQWITHHGSSWPYLFLVERGKVSAVKESSGGRSLVVMVIEEGEVFWGVGFFKEGLEMPVALIADEETRLRLWKREDLLPTLLENGRLSWGLTELMAERMIRASEILEELAFQPVAGRLAHLLLEQFEDQSGDIVTRDLTLDEMAARIGSTREMVCRHLYHFADKGAIQINRTEFKIADHGLLQYFAEKGKR